MKSTKMIVMLAMGGLLALTPALLAADTNTPPASTPPAGGPPGGGPRGARFGPTIEQLTTNLSLTADQVPKVKAVLDDQRKQMTDLRNDPNFSSMSTEDRTAKMQAIRTDVLAKMKEILTPDQLEKYQKMRPMGGGRRPGGGGGGGNGAPPQN